MATDTVFQPYNIISQSGSSLQLKADNRGKLMRIIFLIAPLILVVMGVVLCVTQKQRLFLVLMGGIAVLEYLLFSFIKIPGDVQLDAMGFTLQTSSIKGVQTKDYLWTDVDYIRQRITQTKGGMVLTYHAILLSGKKISFLSFPNYKIKNSSAEQVNSILQTISKKAVREKN